MLHFLIALTALLALGAIGHWSSKRTGYTVRESFEGHERWLYRGIAVLSMMLSAALLYVYYRESSSAVEPGGFAATTSWRGHGIFGFLLWLCLSGLFCFVATNLVMGGYVATTPSRSRGITLQQRASLEAARVASQAAKGNPLVPLWGFVTIGLPCLMGLGLMQARYVRSSDQGIEHKGVFDLSAGLLPWERIGELSVVRVKDPDAGPYVRWNLHWIDTEGEEVMVIENRNVWSLMPATIDAAISRHEQQGISVSDPRPARDRSTPKPAE